MIAGTITKKRPRKDLAGGFNPFEKYQSNWIMSPSMGKNKKSFKPPRDLCLP